MVLTGYCWLGGLPNWKGIGGGTGGGAVGSITWGCWAGSAGGVIFAAGFRSIGWALRAWTGSGGKLSIVESFKAFVTSSRAAPTLAVSELGLCSEASTVFSISVNVWVGSGKGG